MAGTVTGKVCVVDLQFQKSFTYWQCQSYRTYWQYQNLFRSCKNLSLNVVIKNNWKLQKTFSPMNMPSFVTAPTVASTTTWGRISRWSCFRYSTYLKILHLLVIIQVWGLVQEYRCRRGEEGWRWWRGKALQLHTTQVTFWHKLYNFPEMTNLRLIDYHIFGTIWNCSWVPEFWKIALSINGLFL